MRKHTLNPPITRALLPTPSLYSLSSLLFSFLYIPYHTSWLIRTLSTIHLTQRITGMLNPRLDLALGLVIHLTTKRDEGLTLILIRLILVIDPQTIGGLRRKMN